MKADGRIALDFPLNVPARLPWTRAAGRGCAGAKGCNVGEEGAVETWLVELVATVLSGSACTVDDVAALWYSRTTRKLLVVLGDAAAVTGACGALFGDPGGGGGLRLGPWLLDSGGGGGGWLRFGVDGGGGCWRFGVEPVAIW